MKILISAGEASSDMHGAQLLKALRKLLPAHQTLEVFGIGGPKLQAEGLEAIVDSRDLLAMGFVEVLKHLPKIRRCLNLITEAAEQRRPDLAVFIDYPDFHFRLARRLRRQGVPLVYFIPPKVWVWRKKRAEFLRRNFEKILCIFPFEEGFYRDLQIPAKYVGNPLEDELPLERTREQAREKLNLAATDRVLVLMPGSRPSELDYHLLLMLNAAESAVHQLRERNELKAGEKLRVLLPLPETADLSFINLAIEKWKKDAPRDLEVQLSQGNSADCLLAADVGLIKSGTSTLEAGLLRCPHAIVFKPSRVTSWIFRFLIRYRGAVGLVNLVAGASPSDPHWVNEILCEEVTEERLSKEIISLLTDPKRRANLLEGFEILRQKMRGSGEQRPALRAAQEVYQVWKETRR